MENKQKSDGEYMEMCADLVDYFEGSGLTAVESLRVSAIYLICVCVESGQTKEGFSNKMELLWDWIQPIYEKWTEKNPL